MGLVVLALLLAGAAVCLPDCPEEFRPGRDGFVLSTEDSVRDGAVYLSSPPVHEAQDCVRACCAAARCNLALVERAEGSELTCSLIDCLHRNRFVCQFHKQPGFEISFRDPVYREHLAGPAGESSSGPPSPGDQSHYLTCLRWSSSSVPP